MSTWQPIAVYSTEQSQTSAVLGQLVRRVEEIQLEMSKLKETVSEQMQKDNAQKKITIMAELMSRLKIIKQLEGCDWALVRNYLEYVLDHSSLAYRQLQTIPASSTSVFWTIGSKGYAELATVFMVAGLDVNMPDGYGNTLLHGTAKGSHVKLAELLLRLGADREARNKYGNTPIIIAARDNQEVMVSFLKKSGADINACGYRGMIALHRAASNGHVNIVRYLVENGANTLAKDIDWRTPLDLARNMKHQPVVRYLIRFPH